MSSEDRAKLRTSQPNLVFCGFCGTAGELIVDGGGRELLFCLRCRRSTYADSNSTSIFVSVVAIVHAEAKLLMIRRGVAPYIGTWAPPGGFVEAGESLEAAAAREVREECGLMLNPHQFVPYGITSLPKLNQFAVTFLARIDRAVELSAGHPEALDARWFSNEDMPVAEVWEPAIGFDWSRIFKDCREYGRDFYQWSDDSLRVIRPDGTIEYLWQRDSMGSDN